MQEIIGTWESRLRIIVDDRVQSARWELLSISFVALIPAWLIHAALAAPFPLPEIVAFGTQFLFWRVLYGHPIPGAMNAAIMTLAGFLLTHTGWAEGPVFWSLTVLLAALSMAYGCAVGGESQVLRWRARL